MKKWKCAVCGYIHNGPEPPDKCPVCGADKSKFILLEDNTLAPAKPEPAAAKEIDSGKASTQWRCSVCGYVHKAAEPPDKCLVCGSNKDRFVRLEPSPDISPNVEQAPLPESDNQPEYLEQTNNDVLRRTIYRHQALAKQFTRLHAHPIAVHIPNGVLPVTVIFTLLALFFKSEGLALAAKCNLFFICLSMPVVILTGIVDWQIRFGGRMSRVFGTKMICAGIVLVLSLILALWGLFQSRVYLGQTSTAWLFVLINLADLTAAAVAGWYGGKLVFPST